MLQFVLPQKLSQHVPQLFFFPTTVLCVQLLLIDGYKYNVRYYHPSSPVPFKAIFVVCVFLLLLSSLLFLFVHSFVLTHLKLRMCLYQYLSMFYFFFLSSGMKSNIIALQICVFFLRSWLGKISNVYRLRKVSIWRRFGKPGVYHVALFCFCFLICFFFFYLLAIQIDCNNHTTREKERERDVNAVVFV